jgi:hypothetical protein
MQQQFLATVCKKMSAATPYVIKQGFKHPQPVYRYASAVAVGNKGLKEMHVQLIELLDDDDVCVQQTARLVLKKMSKGQDFGPLPSCECQQVQESMQMWREWWKANEKKIK